MAALSPRWDMVKNNAGGMKGDLPFLVLTAGSSAFCRGVGALQAVGAGPVIPPSASCRLRRGVGIGRVSCLSQRKRLCQMGKAVFFSLSLISNR